MFPYAHTKMKKFLFISWMSLLFGLLLIACEEDDAQDNPAMAPPPVNTITYQLAEVDDSGVRGFVTFSEEADGGLTAETTLIGVSADNTYDVGIYTNSAAEGGNPAITLETIDGTTRRSTTTVSEINYEQLLTYDGYVSVQPSGDLDILAQADIGGNALTGESKQYTLGARSGSGITGTVLWEERVNGTTKATITLEDFTGDVAFPSHIHANSAAEGGGIMIDFNSIDPATGTSVTTIRQLNDAVGGTPVTYEQLLDFDGYVNVHRSAEDLSIISQTDIGANELTGNSETYPLDSVAIPAISGTVTFAERQSGETLVTVALDNTPEDGTHPAYLYDNTAVEGSSTVVLNLTPVNGATGTSLTNVATLNDGTPIPYESLVRYDGYLGVYQEEDDTSPVVAQGDIGGNALTGESVTYRLDSVSNATIQGEATFYQRNNGLTLAVISLQGTPEDGVLPAYIRANTAAEGGAVAISLNPVDGTSGLSKNSIRQFDDGTPVSYEQLLAYDGHLAVDPNSVVAVPVAQIDIGQNALTGNQVVYPLAALGGSDVNGTATFAERNNGFSLVTLVMTGTPPEGDHPSHIHFNSAEEGGGIAISLTNVNGATGLSQTDVTGLDNNLSITYEELIDFDGYINVHLSAEALNVIISQGNVGSNTAE